MYNLRVITSIFEQQLINLDRHHVFLTSQVGSLPSQHHVCKHLPSKIRATWSILILMACFLFFYWVDFILSFYTGFTVTHDSISLNIKTFLELGYADFSPYVLISRNVRVPNTLHAH